MPDSLPTPEQAQAAPVPTTEPAAPTTPVASPDATASTADAAEKLFTAMREGAAPEVIASLQSQLDAKAEVAPTPPAAIEPIAPAPQVTNEPEDEPEPADGEQPPQEPKAPKEPDRFRFKSEEDQLVARIAKTKGISLVEAARIYAGTPAVPASEPKPAPEPEPILESPVTLALSAEVSDLESQLNQAGASEGLFNADIARLTAALSKKNAELAAERLSDRQVAQRQQEQAEASQRSLGDHQRAIDAALAETTKVYAGLADKKSPLYAVTRQVAEELRDPEHPDHAVSFTPEAVRYCADEAARRLGQTPAATTVAAPAAPVAPRAPGPARGSLATAPAPAPKSEAAILAEARENFFRARNAGAADNPHALSR